MNRRIVTATYKVPNSEFDPTEFSDTARISDHAQMGWYVVVDEYVFTGDIVDMATGVDLVDNDGAPLVIEDLVRNPHLLTLDFEWESER